MTWQQKLGWFLVAFNVWLIVAGFWAWRHGRREWLMDEMHDGKDSVRTGLIGIVVGLVLAVFLPWVLPGIYE